MTPASDAAAPPPPYTWRTFLYRFALAAAVDAALQLALRGPLGPAAASGAGAGVGVQILLSGSVRWWREPRLVAIAVVVSGALAAAGAAIARGLAR
jgi:hypothetical protein